MLSERPSYLYFTSWSLICRPASVIEDFLTVPPADEAPPLYDSLDIRLFEEFLLAATVALAASQALVLEFTQHEVNGPPSALVAGYSVGHSGSQR